MRYYRKMFRAFTGIAVIYTLLLETVFIGFYWIPSRHDYDDGLEATASQLGEYTDFRLQSLQQMGLMLNVSEYTKKYLANFLTSYEKLKFVNFVSGAYGLVPGSKHAMAITKYTDDYYILNNSTGSFKVFQEAFYIGNETLEQVIKRFNDNRSVPMQVLDAQDRQGRQMYVVARSEWMGYPQPIYIFTSFYENQLFHIDALGSGTLAVFYRNELVASTGSMNREQLTAVLDKGLKQSGNILTTEPSSVTGFRYVYVTKPQQVWTPTLLLIASSGLIALAASIGLMTLITKRMYTPIKGVLRTTGEPLPVGDEFAHIKSTIETLHTDVETMTLSLEKISASMENKFLHDLLIGLLPAEKIAEGIRQHPNLQPMGPVTAILFKFEETESFGGGFAHSAAFESKLRLDAALAEMFSHCEFCRIVDMNSNTQVLLVSTEESDATAERLRNTILNVEPAFGLEISAVIGPPSERLATVTASYKQALRIADTQEYLNFSSKVIAADEIKPTRKDSVYFPLQSEQALINAVIHCKTSVWQSTLEEIIQTNRCERGSDYPQLSMMLDATVNRIIDGSNIDTASLFGNGNMLELHFRASESYEDLQRKAFDTFGLLASWFAKEQEKSNTGLAEKMIDYVQRNYSKEISLFDLADYLNLSRNYVSALFKSTTGRNFKDYLSEYRHGKAVRIMEEYPEKKLKEVAEMVGCNAEMLSRLFVRYSGMLPSDYQQAQRQMRKEREQE
ncbi:helix-turn-helix domain-containing protein [Cohnella sp. GCM10020058]|uniref:helix-turn-helix domain-containing protein n=1 Tax=Cohnella sp. GCM10020058 TaxID=3317330 RepID=UPI00362B4C44